jgi:hypothetical protein
MSGFRRWRAENQNLSQTRTDGTEPEDTVFSISGIRRDLTQRRQDAKGEGWEEMMKMSHTSHRVGSRKHTARKCRGGSRTALTGALRIRMGPLAKTLRRKVGKVGRDDEDVSHAPSRWIWQIHGTEMQGRFANRPNRGFTNQDGTSRKDAKTQRGKGGKG